MTVFEEAVEDARAWMRLQPGKVRYVRVETEPERVMLRENKSDEYREFWPMRDPRMDNFECVPVLRQASAAMEERAAVVRYLREVEEAATTARISQKSPASAGMAAMVAKAIRSSLSVVREAIERGDHLR